MQMRAVKSIFKWFKSGEKQTYFLAGYAGTGKSTLVDYVIKNLGIKRSHVEFACYTGKAALVLTQKAKGKYKAKTLHRLIYGLDFDETGRMKFVLKDQDELKDVKLIVVDEASMVDGDIMRDLKSFNKKILFIGDQGQLPPVSQKGNEEFLEMFNNPDFELTEIHRQAEGNPIIHLSMLARTKKNIPYGWHGENKEALVISHSQWEKVKQSCYTSADQIICGYNRTRKNLNKDIRNYIGYSSPFPQVGDKLICTQNNWNKSIREINLVNGMTGYVKRISHNIPKKGDIKRDAMLVQFQPDFTEDTFNDLVLVNDHFHGKKYNLFPNEYNVYSQFDYGYAITCHKSQGSQWDKVVVINEVLDPELHHRWLYTAITRSSEKLVLVI
ncbi:ATP-dependent RecD-like DNA helicase [Bacillus velezensis]|nr:ATP-dependent RecD-like DNA helicase [Bacillus velezensis]